MRGKGNEKRTHNLRTHNQKIQIGDKSQLVYHALGLKSEDQSAKPSASCIIGHLGVTGCQDLTAFPELFLYLRDGVVGLETHYSHTVQQEPTVLIRMCVACEVGDTGSGRTTDDESQAKFDHFKIHQSLSSDFTLELQVPANGLCLLCHLLASTSEP